ncbi:alpha/beta fold hydrolase [Kineococcus endophyticus]|uniref:Alpha/beta fold hydrolase n=1 Tax=Kineococcus endophyticus TaxID=1181883 RepID=A0ABV3PDH7_9ACTN
MDVDLAALHREGTGTPLVFLHGFGGTAQDYADIVRHPHLSDRPVLAYDAPGCGVSTCNDLSALSIEFLLQVALAALDAAGIDRFHLIGHSMGGLTGLLLAEQEHARVATFTDIEGNLAPEDCFLSRQIVAHPDQGPKDFMAGFAERAAQSEEPGSALYATSVQHKVHPDAVAPIFNSLVRLSDHGDLLARFLALSMPRTFVYGAHNRHLSYLPQLAAVGLSYEIGDSGHWPMYSNLPALRTCITDMVALQI